MTIAPPASPAPSRSGRRALPALLAAAVLLPGLLSACTADDAAADGTGAAAGTTEAAAVGQCVRDQGYDVADDDFSTPGLVNLPADIAPESDAEDEYFDVVTTCQDTVGGGSLELSDEEKDSFVQEMVVMAQCLRDEGFENVEDPVDGVWFGPEEYEDDPAYEAAIDTCQAGMQRTG